MKENILKPFRAIDSFIEEFSKLALLVTISTMLLVSVLSIILRWLNTGLTWADPLCRHLVFIATFLGGALATGRSTHIAIDIVGKILETKKMEKSRRYLEAGTSLLSCGTLVWLAVASWNFMKIELEFGKIEFLGLHSGYLVGIIPVGVGLIAFRFFYNFLKRILGETE